LKRVISLSKQPINRYKKEIQAMRFLPGFRSFCAVILIIQISITSCSTVSRTQRTTDLGSAAGSSLGARLGKRAGNCVIGATIGAILGGSTGAFIGKRLDGISNTQKNNPLYVIDGVQYQGKEAQDRLTKISSEKIQSIKVLKNKEAVARFGDKGENGAVVIDLTKI
jgi:phage tail tape-measure protein